MSNAPQPLQDLSTHVPDLLHKVWWVGKVAPFYVESQTEGSVSLRLMLPEGKFGKERGERTRFVLRNLFTFRTIPNNPVLVRYERLDDGSFDIMFHEITERRSTKKRPANEGDVPQSNKKSKHSAADQTDRSSQAYQKTRQETSPVQETQGTREETQAAREEETQAAREETQETHQAQETHKETQGQDAPHDCQEAAQLPAARPPRPEVAQGAGKASGARRKLSLNLDATVADNSLNLNESQESSSLNNMSRLHSLQSKDLEAFFART